MYENIKGHNPLAEAAERGEPAPDQPETPPDPRVFPSEADKAETVTVETVK